MMRTVNFLHVLVLVVFAILLVGALEDPAPGQDVKCNCILDEDD